MEIVAYPWIRATDFILLTHAFLLSNLQTFIQQHLGILLQHTQSNKFTVQWYRK